MCRIMLPGFIILSTALVLCEAAHVSVPPSPTLQSASVSFKDEKGREIPSRSFGIYYQSSSNSTGVVKNHTDIRVTIDTPNLDTVECHPNRMQACVSPGHPGAYIVACKEDNIQGLVDSCISSGNGQLELIIMCVSESRAEELLMGDALTLASDVTLVLMNYTYNYRCPLFERVSNAEIEADTNVSVTVENSGTCKLETILTHPILPGSVSNQDANLALLSLFAIGLIAAIAGLWIMAVYLKRRCNLIKSMHSPQEQAAVAKALRKCPVKAYKPPKKDTTSEDKCAICLEEYQVKVLVRQLTCKHRFHKVCIDRWLTDKRTCPLCKQDIVAGSKGNEQLEMTEERAVTVEGLTALTNLRTGSYAARGPIQWNRQGAHAQQTGLSG